MGLATALWLFAAVPGAAVAQQDSAAGSWVERSDSNAIRLLRVTGRFAPEAATALGLTGLDDEILDLRSGVFDRTNEALRTAVSDLGLRYVDENHPDVLVDLELLINAAEMTIVGRVLRRQYLLPYFDLPEGVYLGIRSLLDAQVPPSRRWSALVRLRRYAGQDSAYVPLAELAEARLRERLDEPGLLGPMAAEIEEDLATSRVYLDGIAGLFEDFQLPGYETALSALTEQMATYEAFIRAEVLPRARTEPRLPTDLYAHYVRDHGVDVPVAAVVSRARVAFRETQYQLQLVADQVAARDSLPASDYVTVLRALTARQIPPDSMSERYRTRLDALVRAARRARLVTSPSRSVRIRSATVAESITHRQPSAMLPGGFARRRAGVTLVLPSMGGVDTATADSIRPAPFVDHTHDAAVWALAAHEGRPGRELRMSAALAAGLPMARTSLTATTVSREGWPAYIDGEMLAHLPPEGQLVLLQHRLLRAAGAWLDAGLQGGRVSPDRAAEILETEVGLSAEYAQYQVSDYLYRRPGHAVAAFHGYTLWMELRVETELDLGTDFDPRAYHDFLLEQGMVPISALRTAVRDRFVPARRDTGAGSTGGPRAATRRAPRSGPRSGGWIFY